MGLGEAVPALLGAHPLVDRVSLVGSRATGDVHHLSDWDFAVEARAFDALARELPAVVEPLQPLAAQWDRYSDHACYMLILRGPTKVDLIFPNEGQTWAPAWDVSPETLAAIDDHFWDWILWLTQKELAGHAGTVAKSLGDMHRLMLEPMGAESEPRTVREALDSYLERRGELELRFGISVPRLLEEEVLPVLR